MAVAALSQTETYDLPALDQPAFKKLNIRHRRVIYLHLQGHSNKDIATALGRSPAWIGNVLRNPAITPVLEALYNDFETELQGMTGLAVDAIRDSLEYGDRGEQMKAADLLFKRQGAYNRQIDDGNNAEAVIARFLAAVEDVKLERNERPRLLRMGGGRDEDQPQTEETSAEGQPVK